MIDVFSANGVETELVYLGKQPIAGCIACGKCYGSGRCIFNNKVNKIMDRIDEFDGGCLDLQYIMRGNSSI